MLPCLCDHGGGFDQYAEIPQCRVESYGEPGVDTEALAPVAVALLYPALHEPAVPAHIPLVCCAGLAGYGVGTAHDANHEVSRPHAAVFRSLQHFTQRFVPK